MLENSPVPFVPDIPQNIGSQSDCSFPGSQINIFANLKELSFLVQGASRICFWINQSP
jgi:hypothetical protein